MTTLDTFRILNENVMARWTFPLVPDSNWMSNTSYTFSLPFIYRESDVFLANSALLLDKVVIGKDTRIGKDTIIRNSVIGRGCTIGKGVKLENVILMDHVSVGDDSLIFYCFAGRNVKIGSAVQINSLSSLSRPCILGFDVCIPDKTVCSGKDYYAKG
jgi:translation initiation factor eIF-2B subunit epsilon